MLAGRTVILRQKFIEEANAITTINNLNAATLTQILD